MPLYAISEIKVGRRLREDLGDIGALTRSIYRIGLLWPIVVTPDKKLIAGRRRLEAFKRLNKNNIPVHVVDIRSMARGEFDENMMRKPFTPSERVAISRALLKEIGRKKGGKKRHGQLPAESADALGETGKVRDQLAAAFGRERTSLARAEAVVAIAEKDPKTFGPIKDEMDEFGNERRAYRRMQAVLLTECKKAWRRDCVKWFKKMSSKDRRDFLEWIGRRNGVRVDDLAPR